jgi:nucleoside-diphosphate-sugar epimerase
MGAPDQRRDFVYVADAVEGLLRAALSPAAAGEVVNLGCERAVTVREVVELVRARLAPCPEPLWEGRPRRPGEARRWAASEAKARRLLDWAPPSDGLASGLERTIHWCRSTLDRSLDRSKETPWIPS